MADSIVNSLREMARFLVLSPLDALAASVRVGRMPDTLLLIRLDSIGDYVLFRDFIRILKESERFRRYRITLCGNAAWRNLAECLDRRYLDDFIWIDRKRFHKELAYRFAIQRDLARRGFDTAINPAYSRETFYGDAVIRASSAGERIGCRGDSHNVEVCLELLARRYYTRLIQGGGWPSFEFLRNKLFFEELLGERLAITKPSFPVADLPRQQFTRDRYAVFFPGAAENFRRWRPEHFAAVAEHVTSTYGLTVLIAGGPGDDRLAAKIMGHAAGAPLVKITGQTTLTELAGVIAGAELLVSNDTGAVHIGAALDRRTVCVSNGKHYGRFMPYPVEVVGAIAAVFPSEIEHSRATHAELVARYSRGSDLDINTVTVASVIESIDRLLGGCQIPTGKGT